VNVHWARSLRCGNEANWAQACVTVLNRNGLPGSAICIALQAIGADESGLPSQGGC